MISVDPAELTRQILAGFKPPPRLQLSQYADEFAVMTGNAAEKGRWNTLPYQREILDSFTNPAVETVAIMKSARVGWTKMLGVVVQYYSHQDPCPVMIVQPVKEDAEGYSKEEIKPLFEDTPVLRGLISESKSRGTASNTILLKQLGNGGLIDIVNAASGRSFRRKSRKVVLFDEVDAYPKLDEGDPIKLGRNRADYYWDRKIGMGGTPIFVGGKTEEAFLRGDQLHLLRLQVRDALPGGAGHAKQSGAGDVHRSAPGLLHIFAAQQVAFLGLAVQLEQVGLFVFAAGTADVVVR